MSGIQLAAGNSVVPGLGKEREREKLDGAKIEGGAIGGSVSFLQIQMIAYIVVFSVSGVVPFTDMAFVVFATIYVLVLSRSVFPPLGQGLPPPVFRSHGLFRLWVMLGTVIGLFLPLAYVLGGFSRGDHMAVQGATPHLFLLASQMLTENFMAGLSFFSLPIRALTPILYSARRLVSIGAWIRKVFATPVPAATLLETGIAAQWPLFGRCLALANLLFWSLNLFGFLIPFFLPRAFKKHYEMESAGGQSGKVFTNKAE